MNGLLIAVRGESSQYMGYSRYKFEQGCSLKVGGSPVITFDGRMMLGVIDNQKLYQLLLIEQKNLIFSDYSYKSILNGLSFLTTYEKVKYGSILIITLSGQIYIWFNGSLVHIAADYVAHGNSSEIAMGCLFGTAITERTPEERIHHAFNAVFMHGTMNTSLVEIEKI